RSLPDGRARLAARIPGPHAPGGVARGPEVVEDDRVLVGVHAVPEAVVAEARELPLGRQALERVALKHAVLGHVVEEARLEAEEAAVHPLLEPRLLAKAGDAVVVVDHRDAPLAVRPD